MTTVLVLGDSVCIENKQRSNISEHRFRFLYQLPSVNYELRPKHNSICVTRSAAAKKTQSLIIRCFTTAYPLSQDNSFYRAHSVYQIASEWPILRHSSFDSVEMWYQVTYPGMHIPCIVGPADLSGPLKRSQKVTEIFRTITRIKCLHIRVGELEKD